MTIRRIVNAQVLTMDEGIVAASVEIDGGRIVAAPPVPLPEGRDGLMRRSAAPMRLAPGDAVLDLGGRTLAPGFIDSHLHLLLGGLSMARLDLSSVRTRTEFEDAIAARHASLPADAWLLGGGWSERNWSGHELPDATWLRGCGDRPAVLSRMDHHACLVNDAVLTRIDTRVDPPGGRIVRDRRGAPTGLLQEAGAWSLVEPRIPPATDAEKRSALGAASSLLVSLGLTTVMSMEFADDVGDALASARASLAPRVLVTLLDRDRTKALDFARRFAGDDRLRIIGVKLFLDGTLGSRTARMLEPYADASASDDASRGCWIELAAGADREAARRACVAWAVDVAAAGLSPSMHAIGDAALRLALDIAEAVPASARVRIEHAQTVHPDDVRRTRGRWLSMQPLHRADDGRYAQERLGAARMDRFFAFRRYLDAGAMLAFGSDWPIVSPDPLAGMRSAITGRTFDGTVVGGGQALSAGEALRAYTRDAARMLGLDDIGVVRPGAVADLVVLSHDPLVADWIDEPPRVDATIVGGELAWQRPGALQTSA